MTQVPHVYKVYQSLHDIWSIYARISTALIDARLARMLASSGSEQL